VSGGELGADLERGLGQQSEQPHGDCRSERFAQPRGGGGDVLVAELREPGQLGAERFDIGFQLHDVIMTSS
jgi:hypothetical protein